MTMQDKVKFVLIGFAFFFALWFGLTVFDHGDIDELSGFVKTTAMGLWTAALILFDIKQVSSQVTPKQPPTGTTQKGD